jgi:hypothetical protein
MMSGKIDTSMTKGNRGKNIYVDLQIFWPDCRFWQCGGHSPLCSRSRPSASRIALIAEPSANWTKRGAAAIVPGNRSHSKELV